MDPKHKPLRLVAALVAFALLASACGEFWGKPDEVGTGEQSVHVEPNLESDTFTVQVVLTDEGPDPATIFIPAGQHVMLILRNRGRHEHHFRVAGLLPEHMSWIKFPEIDEYELESLTDDELKALNLEGSIDDIEHALHHLHPVFVPFREESRSGIKPLANEVHAYAQAGLVDVVTFYPTNTGRFQVEDLRYPELTAEVIVFERSS